MQFIFWLLCGVFGAPQMRTVVRVVNKDAETEYYFFVSYSIYYAMLLAMLLLNCFVDKEPTHYKYPRSDVMYK